MNYEAEGRVTVIGDRNQITDKFVKREFVITIDPDGQYPKPVQFQFTGDFCDKLDGVAVGDDVGVRFSLDGRRWTSPEGVDKYFTTLHCWNITVTNAADGDTPPDSTTDHIANDDIPF